MKSKTIRGYVIAGLLVWLPIWATLVIIRFLVDLLDNSMALIPHAYQPDVLLGFHIPGLGVIISLLVVFTTGVIATNFFGKKLVDFGERILGRIPIVRSIYSGVKQVAETILSPGGESFRKVLLVEYPRKGLWSIAFLTGNSAQEISTKTGEEMVTIFIPTTPNPTSGFLMMIPKKDIVELDMSVEMGLKLVISLGVMQPKISAS
ncbi:MAG: DUF502 domain-containing protein [Proteobacteria bacterium]|nr:DUF502 domain-containing protein [Pseudomonadota bacterium]